MTKDTRDGLIGIIITILVVGAPAIAALATLFIDNLKPF